MTGMSTVVQLINLVINTENGIERGGSSFNPILLIPFYVSYNKGDISVSEIHLLLPDV